MKKVWKLHSGTGVSGVVRFGRAFSKTARRGAPRVMGRARLLLGLKTVEVGGKSYEIGLLTALRS
jgi:hypothetical protein